MNVLFLITVLFLVVNICAFGQDASEFEQRLVDQLNKSRADAGLAPLKVDERLADAARKHSELMADKSELAHVLSGEAEVADRLAATGLNFNRSGENVGYNSEFNGLHSNFMKSPPHRENILNPKYTLVGIGIVKDDEGVYWATEDFAHGIVQRTSDEAEDAVAETFDSLRKKSGNAPLKRGDGAQVHDLACSMSTTGKMDPRRVLALSGVHQAITYTNSRPEQMPASAQQAARSKALSGYAVGACFASDKSNPGGTYFVVMAFY